MMTALVNGAVTAIGGILSALAGRQYRFRNALDNLKRKLALYNQLPDISTAKKPLLEHIDDELIKNISRKRPTKGSAGSRSGAVADVMSFIALSILIALIVYNAHFSSLRNLWVTVLIVFLGMFVLGSIVGFSASSIMQQFVRVAEMQIPQKQVRMRKRQKP